jgi:uncharacterized spore protein YtfJ
MSELLDKLGITIHQTQEQSMNLLDKLIATARPDAVFGPPVTSGDYAVITASEVSCGLGIGFGGGGGGDDDDLASPHDSTLPETDPDSGQKSRHDVAPPGVGVGGGGGGFSTARPVAAISVGPDGVHVEPIVDATKVALAFFTTLGAMAMMWSNMQRRSRR